MKTSRKKTVIFFLVIFSFFVKEVVFAQEYSSETNNGITGPSDVESVAPEGYDDSSAKNGVLEGDGRENATSTTSTSATTSGSTTKNGILEGDGRENATSTTSTSATTSGSTTKNGILEGDGRENATSTTSTSATTSGSTVKSGQSGTSGYMNQEKIPGKEQTNDFPTYLKQIINFGFATIGILALFMIVIGAYQYLMAAGNIGKADSAKETISSAFFGLILGLCAWLILYIINPNLLKFDLSGITNLTSSTSTSSKTTASTTSKPGANAGKCVEGTGNCSAEKLSCFGDQAKNASIVCNAESGGSAAVGSGTDKCGGQSASWGVMQINITCHNIGGNSCSSSASCCYNGTSCNASNCTITDSATYAKCIAAASDPATNIAFACSLYKKSGWGQWGAAERCGVT